VVAGAGERRALVGHAQQRRAQLAAGRVDEGGVVQAGRAARRRPWKLARAQREQIGDLRPDDRLVERAAARDVGDAQVDAADVQVLGRASQATRGSPRRARRPRR
jgi:hypothetical protein